MIGLEDFQATIRQKPTLFYDHIGKWSYWSKQAEITDFTFKNQRTTVASCHGMGKTYIAARIAIAFLYAHTNSIVITTAPTWRQVEHLLWKELNNAHSLSHVKLGGNLLKTKLEIAPMWYAMGLSASKPDNAQGIHAEHILVIGDEAAGIMDDMLDALEGLLTSQNSHLLYIGNPTAGNGRFYESHKSSLFYKLRISVFDTPNFTANKIHTLQDLQKFTDREDVLALPIPYPQLVTPLWAWERMLTWGAESPIFRARVMAIFPEEGSDTLIGLQMVESALAKEFDEEDWEMRSRNNVVGIDVARFGDDKSVLIGMDNLKMLGGNFVQGKDTEQVAGLAIQLFDELGFEKHLDLFAIDDNGVGGGVTDKLVAQGYNVLPLNFGSGAENKEDYLDLKTEIFIYLRDQFRDGKISILDFGQLAAQIPMIRFDIMRNGRQFIIGKREMKKKYKLSPDFADALAIAVWGTRCNNIGYDPTPTNQQLRGGDVDDDSHTIAGNLYNKSF